MFSFVVSSCKLGVDRTRHLQLPCPVLRLQSRAEEVSFTDMARITLKGSNGQHFVTTVSWLHLMHVVTNLTHDGPAESPEQRECQAASQIPTQGSQGFALLLLAHWPCETLAVKARPPSAVLQLRCCC